MKKRDLVIPLLMLLIGAGAGFLAREQRQSAETEGSASSAAGDTPETTSGAGTGARDADVVASAPDTAGGVAQNTSITAGSAASTPSVAAPLPPLDTKLADIYDALKARAEQGDGRAACRLAAELQQCADRDFMLEGADRAARMLDERGEQAATPGREPSQWESRRLSMAQQQIDFALALDERCKGISEAQLADHTNLWRRAALSGHVPSMVHYAKGDGFRMRATLDNLEALATYKGEAERMMRQAAAAGSAEAVQQLFAAYIERRSPWSGLLQQAIKPNVVEAQAIRDLMKENGLPPFPTSPETQRWNQQTDQVEGLFLFTTAKQRADAEERLAELRKEWPVIGPAPETSRSPWDRMQQSRESCARDQFATPAR
jgi:hypothetical protein